MRVRRAVGYCDDYYYVGIVPIGAERLSSVQYPVAASTHGCHAGAAGVRSGRGFGQTPGTDVFTCCQLADVLLFLFFRSCEKNMV